MPQSILEISDLELSYGSKTILKKLSMDFYPGKIHGILGVNGAGKTTLFKSIYGMHSPTNGTIKFWGLNNNPNPIAYLETSPSFYPYMKGREYLELLSHNNSSFNLNVWNALFDLPLDHFVETYSTGMKKKLALLGILALNRPIMLLDEPYNGLDLQNTIILDDILEELKNNGKTILLTSHILEILKRNCDRISLLHNHTVQSSLKKDQYGELETYVRSLIGEHSRESFKGLFE